ncbi:hypothetical protein [Stenotrophomonas sp. BIGb0135]|uniref:hypothetical protein n=1 Tax=Stenotrophomonas sp. BIGb0135 TaxID=2940620 RepID=UPI002169669A|nr:hypothetical protein [Stenotrophomonas sp. BIGb0135]MCS4236663.1 hypothetical protein [Stenotrophomonas sp. BIGb0135]
MQEKSKAAGSGEALSPAAVRGIAAVLLQANAGRRVHFGGLDLTEMAGNYLQRHVQAVGFDAAYKTFRKQGFALVTDENNR